jgi:hypothetical protein
MIWRRIRTNEKGHRGGFGCCGDVSGVRYQYGGKWLGNEESAPLMASTGVRV